MQARIYRLEKEELLLGLAADPLLSPVRRLPEVEPPAALPDRLVEDGVEEIEVDVVRRFRRFGKADEHEVQRRADLQQQGGALDLAPDDDGENLKVRSELHPQALEKLLVEHFEPRLRPGHDIPVESEKAVRAQNSGVAEDELGAGVGEALGREGPDLR